ncbi:MAG: hypothetical protein C0514_08885 [Candidatus Puniceispirillum sp.]|nr:hypothetical protein [Candidatus Puniceispirillum sp.]
MSKKHLLLSIAGLATILSTSPCHSSASSSTSAALSATEFEFAPQVFGRYAASNLDEEMPSLAQLYQDAVERKKHIDGLFSFVSTHGMTKPTKELTKGLVTFHQNMRFAGGITQKLPDDLMLMSIFKGDFAVERDMMTYCVKALERLAANPTQEHIEELYAQTVYTTRLNLQSLVERMFIALHFKYPSVFKHEMRNGVVSKAIFRDELHTVLGQMSLVDLTCATFCTNMGKDNTELHERDTPEITSQTRGLLALDNLNEDGIIFDLNSLSFYLNLERALLAACASLRFEPEKYGFRKKIETHKDRFVLSALLSHHNKGLLNDALKRQYKPTELALITRNKEKLLKSTLTDTANGVLATMLARLGIGSAKTATTLPSKPATRGPTPRKHVIKKTSRTPAPMRDEPSVLAPPLSPLLFEREEIDVDTRPQEVTLEEAQALAEVADADQDADLAQVMAADQGEELETTPQETGSSSSSALRVTRLIPDLSSYTYKRDTAWTPEINIASYIFNGASFQMPGALFDLEQLKRIKELTHHKPGEEQLPNLASSHLRFHYEVDGTSRTLDFIGRALYLSGGNRFRNDEPYRTQARIQNAFHNVLSAPERRAFLTEDRDARWQRLTHKTTQTLNSSVATGPWGVNCADSEGILLVDLARQLPHYLANLAAHASAPLHIQGVVLGVSTYRDPCWRCRNLLQGWQWGLENALTVATYKQDLPITVAQDMPTLVYGFGEIKPDSRDFFPPRMSQEETVLSTASKSDYASKTHKLRLVAMRR